MSPSHSQTGPTLARGSYSWPSFSGMSLFAAGSSISVIEKQYSSEHMVILHAGLARFAYQLWQSRALGMNHLNAPKFLLFSAIRQSETLWGCVREGTVVGSAVTPGSSDAGACVGMRFGGRGNRASVLPANPTDPVKHHSADRLSLQKVQWKLKVPTENKASGAFCIHCFYCIL